MFDSQIEQVVSWILDQKIEQVISWIVEQVSIIDFNPVQKF